MGRGVLALERDAVHVDPRSLGERARRARAGTRRATPSAKARTSTSPAAGRGVPDRTTDAPRRRPRTTLSSVGSIVRSLAAAVMGAALLVAGRSGVAAANGQVVLHEPIPPDPAEDLALRVALSGDLPAAIKTPGGVVERAGSPAATDAVGRELRDGGHPRRVHSGHRHEAARGQRLRRPLHPFDGALQASRRLRRRAQRLPRRGARPAPRATRGAAGRRAAERRRGRLLRRPRRRPSPRGECSHSQRGARRARRPREARHRRHRRYPSRSCATAPTTGFCSRRWRSRARGRSARTVCRSARGS